MTAPPTDIPSYYDRWVARQAGGADASGQQRLARHRSWRAQGRFVPWAVRRAVSAEGLDRPRRSEIPDDVLIMSQGTAEVMQWAGQPLFKNVFDFALLPMLLTELRPAVILEIGSGTGASALWLVQLASMHAPGCAIVSLDIHPVAVRHPAIRFIQGDARLLSAAVPDDWSAKGPRLVIEDAHSAVGEVLDYADGRLAPGDYLVIEDSIGKGETLGRFLDARPGRYAVDTRYTDFFGRNATSCIDSILRRMQ